MDQRSAATVPLDNLGPFLGLLARCFVPASARYITLVRVGSQQYYNILTFAMGFVIKPILRDDYDCGSEGSRDDKYDLSIEQC